MELVQNKIGDTLFNDLKSIALDNLSDVKNKTILISGGVASLHIIQY